MIYDVIATGSDGNAVVVEGRILIDCGVPYRALARYVNRLSLVLLTHQHGDHFRTATVRALHRERPALRWGCCEWMVQHLIDAGVDRRVIDVYEPGTSYRYDFLRGVSISPVPLIHNVPNCGYKIRIDGERMIYATDTGTLDGVEARGYDLYLIEANHTRAELDERIRQKAFDGIYAYEREAARNHLSREQAMDWLAEQMGPKSLYQFLHQHKDKEGAEEWRHETRSVTTG